MSWWLPTWAGGKPAAATASPGIRAPPPKNAAETVQQLDDNIEALESRRIQAEFKSLELKEEARKHHAAGDKTRAMAAMRRKKTYDAQIKQYDGQIQKMEQTSMAVDSTAASADIAASLKDASTTMKDALAQMSIDDIDQVAGDIEEHIGDAHEASEALSRPLLVGEVLDDDDLEAEMAGWDDNGDGQNMVELPSVPTHAEKPAETAQKPVELEAKI